MNNWETTEQEVFVMKGQKAIVTFKATKELNIKDMKASCGCSKPDYDKKTRELVVSVSTKGSVPKHIKEQGVQVKHLSVKVSYKDAPAEVLKFKVTIKL